MSIADLPSEFSPLTAVNLRLGQLELASREQPACLWAVASGYIGPALLRRELAIAAEFGDRHGGGWSYVVDSRAVRIINPTNPLFLRRIPRLPNISGYVVIAPRWIQKLARFGAMFVRPTAIVSAPEDALAMVNGR